MTPPATASAALLLLADGRFPAGGHAHSGGLEVAVADGRVRDLATLAAFLRGRLHTTGLVQAALAAAACAARDAPALADLDAHADARHPAPVARRISRAQGRAVLRAGRAIWPHPLLDALTNPHHPVAYGAVAAAAGIEPAGAATATALAAVSGPATAAVRLLGLDPYGVHAALAALAGEVDAVAAAATAAAGGPYDDLPACTAPRLDIDAVRHVRWEVRLFAS